MTVQVLVFTLDETRYCVTIETVNEIVQKGALTPIPNAADHVRGVMDLRGETRTILDPKLVLDEDGDTDPDRVIIFESETDRSVGWLVDQVHEVTTLSEAAIESVSDEASIRGVVREDDRFIIWIAPEVINAGVDTRQSA